MNQILIVKLNFFFFFFFTLDTISNLTFNSAHVEFVLHFTLTLVSEQDRSHLRPLAVEADRDLVAVASHYQPPH